MREDLFDPTRHHAPVLLVYMWRYGGHVGDQEQKRVVYHVSFPQSVPTISEGYILVIFFSSSEQAQFRAMDGWGFACIFAQMLGTPRGRLTWWTVHKSISPLLELKTIFK